MIWLYAVQFAAPLISIAWMLLLPARSRLGFTLQCLGSAAALGVMALRGIWLLPPWWAPWLFAAMLGIAAWLSWHRIRPFVSALPANRSAWVVLAVYLALGTTSAYGTVNSLRSRSTPVTGVVNLEFPLEAGRYLVVNGGSDISTNAHLETLDAGVPGYRAWRGQSYGVDLVALNGFGLRARGVQPTDPRAYRIYDARVLAPCAGKVVIAVDGLPDMQVPDVDRDHLAGNHVMLRCAEADVLLGHLQPSSVRVSAGAGVAEGAWLGLVGNSGNTGEPHLHIHAQDQGSAESPLSGDPRPIQFNDHFPVRGDRIKAP
ncbi:MAG: peptidoglycan DD-metalloendopeptidase family protein [Burkholderiaceae bacterium]